MTLIVVSTILSTLVGALIGSHKGYTSTGVVLGLILGWIGVIIIACMKPSQEVQIRKAQEQMAIWAAAGQRMQGPVQQPQQWQIPPQRPWGDQ